MGPMMPMNNPLMVLMNATRGGGNPMQMLQKMAGGNPQVAQAMQIIQGKNPQQLRQMAMNMAKERGLNVNDIAGSMGVTLPKM